MNAIRQGSAAAAGPHPFGDPIVHLAGVSKTYAGASSPALHPTDLSIAAGEFFSILGPSGSGKTTTLRLIAGFDMPDAGSVSLGGVVVTNLPPNRRDVNTVFQSYALFPHLTVAQNVAYPLQMRHVRRDATKSRVAEALDLVDMAGFGQRLPHQLSGGQRQRIALARALVGRPKVLLLDEPLGALDLRLRQQMQHVLTGLQRRLGITFVYVTHDQGEALSMSNRVAIMNKGRIEQIGTPEDLYYAPKNEFVGGFVGKSNLLPIRVVAAEGRLRSSLGANLFDLPRATRAGDAKLAVRCECVDVGEGGAAAGGISLSATVRGVLFLGTGLEVSLDCAGTELIALLPTRRRRELVVGAQVQCRFRLEDTVLLYD